MLFAGFRQARAANDDSLLTNLSGAIHSTAVFDSAHTHSIAQLKKELSDGDHLPGDKFLEQQKIYEAYKLFTYDSAYGYAQRLMRTAREMQDAGYIAAARLKLCFTLLSAGLYKETFDSLRSFSSGPLPDSLKGEYYILWGRYYYDLAGYDNDHYHSVDYDILAGRYMDTALRYYAVNSFEYIYYKGLKQFKQGDLGTAASLFDQLLSRPGLTDHELALTASTLSAIALAQGDRDRSIDLLIRATIADIHTSTKETVAIFHLAELLYKKGDLKHAVMCIESGVANAEFYGARQRKIQASSILPLIEGERINGIEAQKSLLIKYAALVTILVLALMALAWIVLRQIRKLKLAQQALTEANTRQQIANRQLEESNHRLAVVNDKLEEANKIKEEYIGYFFNIDSEFYNRLGKLKATIEQKLQDRRYDDIKFTLNKIDARKEKEELLLSFDRIFCKLFPHFAREVNALLRDDEKIRLREGELLTTDLRIFALMRMGVTDPEKIASILEYSVKTIYSYKSRLKNKSYLSGEEFEDKIMQIKTP